MDLEKTGEKERQSMDRRLKRISYVRRLIRLSAEDEDDESRDEYYEQMKSKQQD